MSLGVTRHFVRIGERLVHYRRCGEGPPLLLVHQSPASSAELEPLMQAWGESHSCIAPDTPGFGQSDPLPQACAEVDDFADALIGFLDAVGIARIAAYGVHSGAITLIAALRRYAPRFTAVAANGFALWTEEEKADFGEHYLPPFQPQPYGEHLTWLWSRLVEQRWFFPWYRTVHEARMRLPAAPPDRLHAQAMDMLYSGDAYRVGYGAMLRADRTLPSGGTPVLIAAHDGDPLQAHIARFDSLPKGWQAVPLKTPQEVEAACFAHLAAHPARRVKLTDSTAAGAGFVAVRTPRFDGLLHWRGSADASRVKLHGPGSSAVAAIGSDDTGSLALDLPGHGLSDGWADGRAYNLDDWALAVATALERLAPDRRVTLAGHGWSALLALRVAALNDRVADVEAVDGHLPLPEDGRLWRSEALIGIAPDHFGTHLVKAWAATRAGQLFWPWFDQRPETAIPFDPAQLAPAYLARQHLGVLQGVAAQALLDVLIDADREALVAACPVPVRWQRCGWAAARADLWAPAEGPKLQLVTVENR